MIKKVYLILALFLIPIMLYANAGSVLIWFSLFHLIFINLLIGFAEIMFYFIYDLHTRKISLVFSNYLSMFFGYYFIAPYFAKFAGNSDFWGMQITASDSYSLKGFLLGFFIAFLTTLIIELPIHYFSVYKNIDNVEIKREKFLKAFLFGNLFTNIGMFLIYLFFVYKNSTW